MIRFTIPGEPVGKGRPRFSGGGQYVRTYTPKKTADYEGFVRACYNGVAKGFKFEDDKSLEMYIIAYFEIPKSANKKRTMLMQHNAIRPTKKPDADNILKIIADALNKVAYKDDSQIVAVAVEKRYALHPKVEVIIKEAKLYEQE